ncbi:LLM class flavin-dependent oxidoreductase [Bradyrhizobium sp. WSM 1738]|uniref:LLM class flavin-dependent oxidoreductase n=1 Tax=Bradyrhizobium hereditatis TaxID=2821405 RepID=UPI001CE3260D|nr:LLM class flavin-dependent oxidoreductase [Bradyrhizobium hereditatis]MCA6115137.1 LLM class flavin-dependent oxidoreductase [Bradyrhizobium hereditatis]
MTLDLLILGNAPMIKMLDRVKLAEASGYDTVWLADERFYREVYSCLSYFAQNTSRVRLGPCVTDPYARHPALTAMAIATLDEISNKRAILGIGAGISGFAELGIDRKKPARAISEAIEVIRMLLRGETVAYEGEVIQFREGKLNFTPIRADIPIYVASNGPLGQRTAGACADAAFMEAGGNAAEVKAFRARLDEGARKAGRDPKSVKLIVRLNACIASDSQAARDALRPTVARLLGAGRLKFETAEEQGLTLPQDILATVQGAHYAAGVTPYLPLLPYVTDRHINAFTLAGNVEEVTARVIELRHAGVDGIITMPFAAEGGTIEDTIAKMGSEVWPAVQANEGVKP